ncbi:MAG: type IV pilin N-terminal domain-containing protein [Methanoculleus sp.]
MMDNFLDDTAVSPVIGEMLMIVLALLLVSIFSVTLLDLLPSERSPSVEIKPDYTDTNSVTLYHKGGDWIKRSDIQVIVFRGRETLKSEWDLPDKSVQSFDLGDSVIVQLVPHSERFIDGDIIRLVSGKSTVFSGTYDK